MSYYKKVFLNYLTLQKTKLYYFQTKDPNAFYNECERRKEKRQI